MYQDFFRLKSDPFGITPDPDFFYGSPSHREALASIIYGVKMRKGFISVTGEAGVGKTTVIRSYLDSLDSSPVKVVYVFNSNVSFPALLKVIFRELGVEPAPADAAGMIDQLHVLLIKYYREGVNVVLIIDEAQNMPVVTLENLRMLSNLETTKEKLLQIIFSGQPEFDRLLERDDLRQLRQRIAVRVRINRLTRKEGREYIGHRLARANAAQGLFTRPAVDVVLSKADGIPRSINILCASALVTSFGYGKNRVGYHVAAEAASDMGETRSLNPAHVVVAVAVIFLAAAVTYMYGPATLTRMVALTKVKPAAVHEGRDAAATADTMGASGISANAKPVTEDLKSEEAEVRDDEVPQALLEEEQGAADTRDSDTVSRVVGKGYTLSRLAAGVYGYADGEVLAKVARNNPGIKDINIIYEGESITFPVE